MDDLELRIAKLQLAPGDVLVIKSDHRLSPQQAAHIMEHARRAAGEIASILLLDPDLDLSVLTKAEIEARAG